MPAKHGRPHFEGLHVYPFSLRSQNAPPMMRAIYLALGLVMVALGIVGAFLPVMPSTIFLIFAVGFFARSSPRLEKWLLEHRHFGPPLRRWREHGAISLKGKLLAWSGMAFGYTIFLWSVQPDWPLTLAIAAFFMLSAAIVWSRPTME